MPRGLKSRHIPGDVPAFQASRIILVYTLASVQLAWLASLLPGLTKSRTFSPHEVIKFFFKLTALG
jgi:hypothetical protein